MAFGGEELRSDWETALETVRRENVQGIRYYLVKWLPLGSLPNRLSSCVGDMWGPGLYAWSFGDLHIKKGGHVTQHAENLGLNLQRA